MTTALLHDGHDFNLFYGNCRRCGIRMSDWWTVDEAARTLCPKLQGVANGHLFQGDGTCYNCGILWDRHLPPCGGGLQFKTLAGGPPPHHHPSLDGPAIWESLQTIKRDEAEARRLAEAQETTATEDPIV